MKNCFYRVTARNRFFVNPQLPLESLAMLTSDGASLMTGRSGGVVAGNVFVSFCTLFNQKKEFRNIFYSKTFFLHNPLFREGFGATARNEAATLHGLPSHPSFSLDEIPSDSLQDSQCNWSI